MKIALSSDERNALTDFLGAELERRGHSVVRFGALDPYNADNPDACDWPVGSSLAAAAVTTQQADEAIVCCWTGTGAALAASKVAGARAALCHDAVDARGARVWSHANVLALSLRTTSEPMVAEILDAWFATPWSEDAWNLKQIRRLEELERRGAGSAPEV